MSLRMTWGFLSRSTLTFGEKQIPISLNRSPALKAPFMVSTPSKSTRYTNFCKKIKWSANTNSRRKMMRAKIEELKVSPTSPQEGRMQFPATKQRPPSNCGGHGGAAKMSSNLRFGWIYSTGNRALGPWHGGLPCPLICPSCRRFQTLSISDFLRQRYVLIIKRQFSKDVWRVGVALLPLYLPSALFLGADAEASMLGWSKIHSP